MPFLYSLPIMLLIKYVSGTSLMVSVLIATCARWILLIAKLHSVRCLINIPWRKGIVPGIGVPQRPATPPPRTKRATLGFQ